MTPDPLLGDSGRRLLVGGHRSESRRGFVVVDVEDVPRLSAYRWTWTGHYAHRQVGPRGARQRIYMQRELMGLGPDDERVVTFVDGNPRNCQKSNLRVVDNAGRSQNTRARRRSTSHLRGVSFYARSGKWQAQACVDGQRVHLGYFDSEEGADEAVRAWRGEHLPHATRDGESFHGTLGGYQNHGCRCGRCRAEQARYMDAYKRRAA